MRNLLFALLFLLGSAALAAPARADDELLPRHRPRVTAPDESDADSGAASDSKGKRRHARPIEDQGDESTDEARPSRSRSRSHTSDDSDSSSYRSRSRASDDSSDDGSAYRSRSRAGDDSDEAVPARSRSRASDDSDEAPAAYRSRSTSDDLAPAGGDERRRSRSSASDDEESGSGRSYDEETPRRRSRSADDDEGAPQRRSRSADDDEDWNSRPTPRHTAEEDLRAEESGDNKRLSHLDEPGTGLAAEINLGAIFLDDSIDGFRTDFAWGLGLTWQLGRLLFAPENAVLHNGIALEAAYLHPLASDDGTNEVRVTTGYHDLWLAALIGYPFKQLHVYGKVGPAMFVQPVDYDVQGQMTSWTATKAGLVYGLGVRTTYYFDDNLGFAARVELSRFRRGYMNDTLLSGGIGLAF